jgi:hypothetical protein
VPRLFRHNPQETDEPRHNAPWSLAVVSVLGLFLAVLAIGWLAWLSPPSHWFTAKAGEPRVAVPVSRVAPNPVEAIRGDIEDLDARVSDLEDATGSSDLQSEIDDLQSRVDDLESRTNDVESRVDDVEPAMDDIGSSVDDLTSFKESLCDEFSFAEGVLYDAYAAAC